MTRPTIVAFYPIVSNDSLAKDEGLAAALDDLSYHIGSAMDSLIAAGVRTEADLVAYAHEFRRTDAIATR